MFREAFRCGFAFSCGEHVDDRERWLALKRTKAKEKFKDVMKDGWMENIYTGCSRQHSATWMCWTLRNITHTRKLTGRKLDESKTRERNKSRKAGQVAHTYRQPSRYPDHVRMAQEMKDGREYAFILAKTGRCIACLVCAELCRPNRSRRKASLICTLGGEKSKGLRFAGFC
jgi:sigma54-dependent transcription regulator